MPKSKVQWRLQQQLQQQLNQHPELADVAAEAQDASHVHARHTLQQQDSQLDLDGLHWLDQSGTSGEFANK